jgi:NADPH2:quinone reductase
MKAIVCEAFGPIENLKYVEVPAPIPSAGQLLIDVKAAGVNFPDALLVRGEYQLKPQCPFIPGSEVAGVVSAIGAGVEKPHVGDRVMAVVPLGGFAEEVAAPANVVFPLPDGIPDIEAAGLLIAHGTAHHALKQRARLQAGETLVVTGAAGGTGLAAVQIGKAMGARVVAVCSSAEKLAVARANGADMLINSGEGDLKGAIKNACGARGADVAYDAVGGETFDALTRCMGWNGRLLVIGFASGGIPQFPVNLALVKGYSVVGVFWGGFTKHQPDEAAANARELLRWYQEGEVRVVVDSVLPLSNATAALQKIMGRKAIGKIVLRP